MNHPVKSNLSVEGRVSSDWAVNVPDWVTGRDYIIGDLINESGRQYRCVTAHTSGATFAADAANWVATAGSPLTEVGTGNPNIDPSIASFRTARVGFNEPNPEELLDVVGNQAADTGAIKLDYAYDSGASTRIQLGGLNMLSEVGVPSASTEGWILDYFGEPTNYPGMRAYVYGGDFSGAGTDTFSGGSGLASLTNDRFARIVYQPRTNNDDTDWWTRVQARNAANQFAEVVTRSAGVGTGFGLEAQVDLLADNDTEQGRLYLSPHLLYLQGGGGNGLLVQNINYGSGTYVEGYTHGDTLAKTGTAATTIGAPAFNAAFDANGVLMEVPISGNTGFLMRDVATLNSLEIQNRGTTPIPFPNITVGSNEMVIPHSITIKWEWTSAGYDGNPIEVGYIGGAALPFATDFLDNSVGDQLRVLKINDSYVPSQGVGLEVRGIDSVALGDTVLDVLMTYEIIDPGGFSGISDLRLKTNVQTVKEFDNGLRLVTWDWNEEAAKFGQTGTGLLGFIAQEVAEIFPEAVFKAPDGYFRIRFDVLGQHIN